MLKRGISSVESVFLEEYIMKQVNCPIGVCLLREGLKRSFGGAICAHQNRFLLLKY